MAGAGAGAGAVAAAVEAVLAPDEAGSSEQHAPQQPRSTASDGPDPVAVASVSERTRGKRKQRS